MVTQTQAQTAAPVLETVAGATDDEMTGKPNGSGNKSSAKAANMFDEVSAARSRAMAEKLQEQQKARQFLAEAADLDNEGGEAANKAAEVAGRAGLLLTTSLISQRMDRDEVTSILGEYYGFRLKGDAKVMVKAGHKDASKTPFGRGEEIRKRAFRLLRGHEYVSDGEGDRFFSGDEAAKVPPLPKDDVAQVVEATSNGKLGFWASYERFAEIRRDANEGRETSPAFNVRTINAVRAGLVENVATSREKIANDPVLLASYAALRDALNLVGSVSEPAKSKAN